MSDISGISVHGGIGDDLHAKLYAMHKKRKAERQRAAEATAEHARARDAKEIAAHFSSLGLSTVVVEKGVKPFERKLLKYLGEKSSGSNNFAYSGISIEAVLGGVGLAAAGDTQKQVVSLLTDWSLEGEQNVDVIVEEIVRKSAELQALLKVAGGGAFKTGNALVFGVSLEDPFKEKAASNGLELVVPTEGMSVEDEADRIVRKGTDGMIKNSGLKKGEDVKIALINTIYFKAKFSPGYAFGENNTIPAIFTPCVGEPYTVQMMEQNNNFYHTQSETYMAAKIPFESNGFNLVLVLPHESGMNALTELDVNEILGQRFAVSEITVKVPKFKLAVKEELKPFLKAVGMTDAFMTDKANFSPARKEDDLVINQVVHQVVFMLDAQGVEAAASTVASLTTRGIGSNSTLICDRPFMVLIEYGPTRTALFTCGMVHPEY
jgi:serpin B